MFYRYTVPGAVVVFAVLLALPYSVIQKSWTENNAVLITVIVANVIIAGWALYHAVYPILTQVLVRIRLYPRPNFMKAIVSAIKHSGRELKASDVWSYFLWSYCSSGTRERVKMLADYGHSIYLVAFTFFIFPFFQLLATLGGSDTLLRYIIRVLVRSINADVVEGLVFGASFAIAAALLYNGRRRILQAYEMQEFMLIDKRSEFDELIKKFKA